MVFLQAAARKTSVAGACLEMAEQGHIHLCLSEPVLAEIQDVLLRPEIQARFPSITEPLVNEFLAAIRQIGQIYEVGRHFAFSRDPKDEPYLNLAIETRARYLASRDNDILDLRHSMDAEAVDFRQRFPEIQILEPIECLREIRQVPQHRHRL
jgi:putative PIN family toxin of toxin-antitoxin system